MIHSDLGKRTLFGKTDRGEKGIHDFMCSHKCNRVCEMLGLPKNEKFVSENITIEEMDSVRTSQISVVKTHHLKQRQAERDISTLQVQRAVKHGFKELQADGKIRHTFDNVRAVTSSDSKDHKLVGVTGIRLGASSADASPRKAPQPTAEGFVSPRIARDPESIVKKGHRSRDRDDVRPQATSPLSPPASGVSPTANGFALLPDAESDEQVVDAKRQAKQLEATPSLRSISKAAKIREKEAVREAMVAQNEAKRAEEARIAREKEQANAVEALEAVDRLRNDIEQLKQYPQIWQQQQDEFKARLLEAQKMMIAHPVSHFPEDQRARLALECKIMEDGISRQLEAARREFERAREEKRVFDDIPSTLRSAARRARWGALRTAEALEQQLVRAEGAYRMLVEQARYLREILESDELRRGQEQSDVGFKVIKSDKRNKSKGGKQEKRDTGHAQSMEDALASKHSLSSRTAFAALMDVDEDDF